MLEEEKPTQIIVRILVFGLHQVMLTRLRRHQGLVLDHCKNEHRNKYKIHKYLDHCTGNDHEEKNTLGLHGAVDRLLLSVHHIQYENNSQE